MEKTRIFTYGYNAGFRPGEAKSTANIADFAKELLFELRFAKPWDGDSWGIGNRPLIIVAHSMGGLLAKKACLLGQNDEHYKDIIQSLSAIIFLSTPHRGSNLAEVLNRVLAASFQTTRSFITDLNKSSSALEEINEQFRHVAPRLSIWSFYETLPTPVGPKKMMVLEKDSSILGYATEISRPLTADHHGVCKFTSQEDVNYVSVRNALTELVHEVSRKVERVPEEQSVDEINAVQELFALGIDPDDDLDKHSRLRIEGTCEWVFSEAEVSDWIDASSGSHLVWFSAAPASGKSVLSAHVATSLQQRDLSPQYFFFNFGDQQKRSVASLLRSVALQIARSNAAYRRGLLDLSKQGLKLDKADASLLWKKAFENLLFKLGQPRPFYWVLDALDECDNPKLFLDLIRSCTASEVPIRIFLTSRPTEVIQMGIAKVARGLRLTKFDKDSSSYNAKDIQLLAEQEVSHMRGSQQIKDRVLEKIMARAEGNFLWTKLVLEEIVYCHTEAAIEETLAELPSDMQELYDRMEAAIIKLPRQSSKTLAKAILHWTMGAQRPMTLQELGQALAPEFDEIIDLKRTIADVCGQFIKVDTQGTVAMIHLTAREYLSQPRDSELFIDLKKNQEAICTNTLTALLESRITPETVDGLQAHAFLLYSASCWTFHLRQSSSTSGQLFDLMVKFFSSKAFPLWIYLLSSAKQLGTLVKAAKSLTLFTAAVRKKNASKNPMLHRLTDLQNLDQWAIDLMKIVGKFASSLHKHPQAIYGFVSPFSPETSALHQQPFCKKDKDLCVAGGLDETWTDRLARFSLPEGCEAYKLACAGEWIAVLAANGRVFFWDSQTFVNKHTVEHGEAVTCITFNAQGDKFATYGLQTTKVWALPSTEVICSVENVEARAITISFTNDDDRILAGFDDRAVRYFDVGNLAAGWQYIHPDLFKDELSAEAAANSPTCVAFSKDGLYAGVAYRGFPLSVWSVESGQCISRCNRTQGTDFSANQYSAGWYVAWRFTWNPVTNHVVGFYTDGYVFKWHPLTGEHQEAVAHANDLAASSDGKLFLTSTSTGVIKVWDFNFFTVVYQLSSDDLLMGLTFSPDCLRFYDLRLGMVNSVNAWEPNSLLRFSEQEEVTSDLVSEAAVSLSTAQISEAWLGQCEAVSALAAAPNGKCFCLGTDDGSVELRSANGGAPIEICKFDNFMGISHLTWSQDSCFLAAADLGGSIMVRQIRTADYGRLAETTEIVDLEDPDVELGEQAIHEMLFSPDSSQLLVVTNQAGHIWSVRDASIQASQAMADANMRKWISHPLQHQLLLGIGSEHVRVYGWHDLKESSTPVDYLHKSSEQILSPLAISPTNEAGVVIKVERVATDPIKSEKVRAMVTQDSKHVLVRLSMNDTFIGSGRFFILPVSELNPIRAHPDHDSTVTVKSVSIPDEIRRRVRIALGVLPGDRFVFLDWELWVCSYRTDQSHQPSGHKHSATELSLVNMDSAIDAVQRHYFIPDDWAMGGSLDLCTMTADGTLLYPRDDKVSLIKADLGRPAFRRGVSAY